MYQYPYGDSQQLNLDWIINKLIELEQSFVAGESAELEEFANALISLTYIPTQAYNNSDIVFHDGHLYRCNTTIPAPGEVWNPAHWDQIMLGNTVANLVRAVAGMNSDHVFNESNVPGTHVTEALNALVEDIRYDNHKIQQKKNGAYTDVIPVEDTPSNNSDRLASSKAAYDLKGAIDAKKGFGDVTTVSSGGDLNNCNNPGVYNIQNNITNSPTEWAQMTVVNFGSVIIQVIYNSDAIYIRKYSGSPAAWSSWYPIFTGFHRHTVTLTSGDKFYVTPSESGRQAFRVFSAWNNQILEGIFVTTASGNSVVHKLTTLAANGVTATFSDGRAAIGVNNVSAWDTVIVESNRPFTLSAS